MAITQMAGEEHYDSGLRLRRNGGQREYIKVYIWWPDAKQARIYLDLVHLLQCALGERSGEMFRVRSNY